MYQYKIYQAEELLSQIVLNKQPQQNLASQLFQFNDFLQNSRPALIETIKNELANVSIFKATIDHMDLIRHNLDDGYINLAEPKILAAETSQKDNLHFGKALKDDDCEGFMKKTGK